MKSGAATSNTMSNEVLDDSLLKTPTNGANILQELSFKNRVEERIFNENNFGSNYIHTNFVNTNNEDTDIDENDVTLEDKMLNDVERLLYANSSESDLERFSDLNAKTNSHSLPQLPIYTFSNCFKNCASKTMSEQEHNSLLGNFKSESSFFNEREDQSDQSSSNSSNHSKSKKEKESMLKLNIYF